MTQVQVNEPAIIDTGARQVLEKINVRVRVRSKWTDAWQTVDYLQPTEISITVAPSTSQATLNFKYGEVTREDRKSFELEAFKQLKDQFIVIERMTLAPALNEMGSEELIGEAFTPLFYGRITGDTYSEDNLRRTATDEGASGDQTVTAFGLEQTLDRIMINQAVIENDIDGEPEIIEWLMPFNERLKDAEPNTFGNKSFMRYSRPPVDSGSIPSFIFNGNPDKEIGSGIWTNRDILEYLLEWFSPNDQIAGNLEITASGQLDALDVLVLPTLDLEGRTLRQCIDKLVDRKRGLGWCVRVDDNDNVEVHVFTMIDEPVSSGDVTIPANAEQHSVELNDRIDLDEVVITKDTSKTFEFIIILGERIRSTFTVELPQQLEKVWTDQDETNYFEADDAERSSSKFSHVFTTFRLRDDWDFKSRDGRIINPVMSVSGELDEDEQGPSRRWDRRILRELPFLKERDPDDKRAEAEHEKPMVWLQHPTKILPEPIEVDRISEAYPDLASADVRASDTEFGFEVRFRPNHILAVEVWPDDGSATLTRTAPKLKFDGMIATITIELDERLKYAVINTAADFNDDDVNPNRILFIDVPDAHFWYVVGGTSRLLEEEDGSIQFIPESGGPIRDDLDQLKAIGALARAWYSKVRTSIDLTIDDITTAHRPGALINAVSNVHQFNDQVGSVITKVDYDITEGETRIQTGFLEIQARSFINA